MGPHFPRMRLQVHLVSGRVPAGDIHGNSDAYCVAKWADSSYESKVVNRSLKPKWNEEFELSPSEDTDIQQSLLLEVYHVRREGRKTSELLGCAAIPLVDLVMGLEKNFWVKLGNKEGGERIRDKIGGILKKRKHKKDPDATHNFYDCRILIGLTALDFGIDVELEEGIHNQWMRRPSLRASGRLASGS